jgi:hypothetical protein
MTESTKKNSIFLETKGLQSKQMTLAQTIWDYANLLLYEMSPFGKSKFLFVKLDLQLTTGNSPVVTHINARCQDWRNSLVVMHINAHCQDWVLVCNMNILIFPCVL